MFRILQAVNPPLRTVAADLFREYSTEVAALCGESLAHQNLEGELASLPGLYAPPEGNMWVALQDTAQSAPAGQTPAVGGLSPALPAAASPRPLGCVAIRPLPKLSTPLRRVCELKRMYVAPAARGMGLGKALCQTAVSFAADAGYAVIKLDTSTDMHTAIGLYRACGFVPAERYNDDPMADTLYFELVL
jgi:ribosomal protein S18 acetylase RimI-like enzyme